MNKIKILLVDDHAVLRKGLHLILDGQDELKVVGEAARGEEAISKCCSLKPDIILLDLSLPDKSGLEVLKELKIKCPHVKVLILTMHEDEAYLRDAIKGDANGYILKKAADTELISAIRAVIRGEMVVDPALTKSLFQSIYPAKNEKRTNKQSLSQREKEVLKLVALGYTNQEIAENLIISIKTVESHKARIKEKLDMTRRSDLVRYAMAEGLLEEE